MKYLGGMTTQKWLMWGSFGAGFLCPCAFLLFLALAFAAAWRAFKIEYADVGRYWHEAAASRMKRCRDIKQAAAGSSGPFPPPLVPRPEPEMV